MKIVKIVLMFFVVSFIIVPQPIEGPILPEPVVLIDI